MAQVWVLTGGIGSGKSTVRQMLAELGARTLDADEVGHDVLEPDGPAHVPVCARWPDVVINGRIDRRRLGRVVFADAAALRELEHITHPAIATALVSQIAGEPDDAVIVVEVSVPRDLLGVGPDRTIVADLPADLRYRRLVGRGMDPDDVRLRMARQPDDAAWRSRGRWVLSTEGTFDEVRQRVGDLWRRMSEV